MDLVVIVRSCDDQLALAHLLIPFPFTRMLLEAGRGTIRTLLTLICKTKERANVSSLEKVIAIYQLEPLQKTLGTYSRIPAEVPIPHSIIVLSLDTSQCY